MAVLKPLASHNDLGDLIGYLDADGTTIRRVRTHEVIARRFGRLFCTPDGELWGYTRDR